MKQGKKIVLKFVFLFHLLLAILFCSTTVELREGEQADFKSCIYDCYHLKSGSVAPMGSIRLGSEWRVRPHLYLAPTDNGGFKLIGMAERVIMEKPEPNFFELSECVAVKDPSPISPITSPVASPVEFPVECVQNPSEQVPAIVSAPSEGVPTLTTTLEPNPQIKKDKEKKDKKSKKKKKDKKRRRDDADVEIEQKSLKKEKKKKKKRKHEKNDEKNKK